MRENPKMIILFCAGILLAVVGFSTLGWAAVDDAAPGRLPAWIEAVATLVALVAASYAGIYAYGAFKLEADRESRYVEATRRAQASLVTAWAKGSTSSTAGLVDSCAVEVRNGSEGPVYDLELISEIDLEAGSNGAGEPEVVTVPARYELAQLHPGPPTTCWPTVDERHRRKGSPSGVRMTLSFRDAAGVRWLRDTKGQLLEVV